MTNPRLTIVMPFFNQEELTAEMMASLQANDFSDWELLAIDDGSTEEAVGRLRHFEQDSRISIIRRTRLPKGAQTCRNMGLEMARGEFIVFFDSDDIVTPHCLGRRVEAISQRPELDFMVFPSGTYNNGHFNPSDSYNVYGYPIYADDLTAFAERTLPFIVWNNIYRTASLRKSGITWDNRLLSLQDSDFNIQALLHGLKYDYATVSPDYGYRTVANGASISKKIASEQHRQSHLYFINKQYEEIQKVHGKKLNRALYRGVLYIYSTILADGIDADLSHQIADTVSRHDSWHGMLLRLKIKASQWSGLLLPKKLARQWPMAVYLVRKRTMERKLIPHRLTRMQKEVTA